MTVICHSMDISSGSRILVERLMFTQSCGNFSSKTGISLFLTLVLCKLLRID